MAAQTTDAWAETRKIQKEFSSFYKIAGGLLLVFIGVMIGAMLFHNDEGYWGNILSEVLGIGFAVFVLDQRAEQRRIKDLQERLVMEAGGQSSETVKSAIHELTKREWLIGEDGLLKGGDLRYSNLEGANLWKANLQEAWLRRANLRGARLRYTNLQGADLTAANLQGANMNSVELDKNTILPDGSKWTSNTDLSRFTDPEHPQFWRSDDEWSPAYHGKPTDVD